jgi:hypothetical protein
VYTEQRCVSVHAKAYMKSILLVIPGYQHRIRSNLPSSGTNSQQAIEQLL